MLCAHMHFEQSFVPHVDGHILEARLPNLCALQYLQCVVCRIWVGFQGSDGSRSNGDTSLR